MANLISLSLGAAIGFASLHHSYGQCQPKEVMDRWGKYPSALDAGIYWYGYGDETEKATGSKSRFFDPSKKTLIFFHGWSGYGDGWTIRCTRATSRCPENVCPLRDLLVDDWIRDGWNIGFFYWDQLADEKCARDAEQKIWMDRGLEGIRWKSFNMHTGESKYLKLRDWKSGEIFESVATPTVGSLCRESVKLAMEEFSGPMVRFVGHSLGAQLAIKCADMLHEIKHHAAPQRLALLEPFFTTIHLGFFRCNSPVYHEEVGNRVPSLAAGAIKRLWDWYRVATEMYKSSALTEESIFGEVGQRLEELSVYARSNAEWCGNWQGAGPLGEFGKTLQNFGNWGNLVCQHMAAFPHYFQGYVGHKKGWPKLAGDAILQSCPVPTSACSDVDIQELNERQYLVDGQQVWEQVLGMKTSTQEDDYYKLLGPSYTSAGKDLVITTTTTSSRTLTTTIATTTLPLGMVAVEELEAFGAAHWLGGAFVIAIACFCIFVGWKSRQRRIRYAAMSDEWADWNNPELSDAQE